MPATLSIGVLIHESSEWLEDDLVRLADEALRAHERGYHVEAIGKAAGFLERFLKRLLAEWGREIAPKAMLGELIGAIRASERGESQLHARLDDANRIRIRALHPNPSPLEAITEGDSLQIINILALVVAWYQANFQVSPVADAAPDAFPVYLSVGGPHRLDQQQFLQRLRHEMRRLGAELRNLTPNEYSKDRPFDQIREIMKTCRAALIVGLERSHAYAVFEREKSDRERVYQDQYVPTAWNQIEGSIASALGLPILILRDSRLHEEGIFEAQNHRHVIREFELDGESISLSPDLREFLRGWVEHTRAAESLEPPPRGFGPD